jgi:hypothetical protein
MVLRTASPRGEAFISNVFLRTCQAVNGEWSLIFNQGAGKGAIAWRAQTSQEG